MPRVEPDKVWLVGEQNPYGGEPHFALYPMPDGCAGQRLCYDILGMYEKDYLRVFERVNLCDGPWNAGQARAQTLIVPRRKLILCGAKVAEAFGLLFAPLSSFCIPADDEDGCRLLIINHPSGRCQEWNKPGLIALVRKRVAEFAPELAAAVGRNLACGVV